MDGQKITKSHEDKAIIPCQLSLLTQILTISMSRQLPSLCVTAIEGSHAQMFTQLTKARFPPGQKISLSLGFIFFEQFFWSYSSSNLKCAGLICIKQSQRAFDCPITKDCYQHTPSVLVHGGRQQFYQKHNFYQEFGIRDRGFDLYQPTSLWLSAHQRLLSEHTPCVKLWQKTMWLSNEWRLLSAHTIYHADLPWQK